MLTNVQPMKAMPTQSVAFGRAAERPPLINTRSAIDPLATAVTQGEERVDGASTSHRT